MRIAILGRQSKISLAELESLFGADNISPVSDNIALVESDSPLPQTRLGGVIKSGKVLASIDSVEPLDIFDFISNNLAELTQDLPAGKLKLGFSFYGSDVNTKEITRHALALKKLIKQTGRSVRIIENKTQTLSSAQVIYNKLSSELGMEFIAVKHDSKIILAQTESVQNIDDYSKRDFDRPKRDARVGMLPPKLAQIIINLAVGGLEPSTSLTILDPFCGTGVVLQEAMLMNFQVYGSDTNAKMVDYSVENMDWLAQKWQMLNGKWQIELADATDHTWRQPIDFIACETYLGRPFSAIPSPEVLQKVMQDVDTIHTKFLQNVARQTKPGFRMCIALPAWKTKNGFKRLKVLENLEQLGYTRIVFEYAKPSDLIYHRENQIVARELVILMRK